MNSRNSALATVAALSLGFASTASAELTFEADNGWEFGVGGYVPVFATYQSFDGEDLDGNGSVDTPEQDEFEVGTGFNPASLNFRVSAPTQNGIDVSAFFQINNHIGAGGNSLGNAGFDGFGSRIARIDIAGDFGTVHIGKTFGIFGTPAIGDAGSGMGVGGRGLGGSLATLGRIGVGYFYADFEPQIQYASNRVNGLGFKAAVIQPDNGGAGETDTPRIEGRIDYQGDVFSVWTSGGIQSVNDVTAGNGDVVDVTQTGIDFGGAVSLGPVNLRGNYAMTSGAGGIVWGGLLLDNTGDEVDYDQWYLEATVDPNPVTTVGVSYGEGGPDVNAAEDRELAMLFGRYRHTDHLTFMVELQNHEAGYNGATGGAAATIAASDYTSLSLGAQLNF